MLGPIALPSMPSAPATAVLWPGRWPPASASIAVACTLLIRAPIAAAAPHCFACRSTSDRILLLLCRACETTYVWLFNATGFSSRTQLLAFASSCPWLDARARRRCRSSRRPVAAASRTRTRPPASTVAVASERRHAGCGRHLSGGSL